MKSSFRHPESHGSFQICQSEEDQTMKKYKEYYNMSDLSDYLTGSNAIKDIGPGFVEDVQLILEKCHNNPYVTRDIMDVVSDSPQYSVFWK